MSPMHLVIVVAAMLIIEMYLVHVLVKSAGMTLERVFGSVIALGAFMALSYFLRESDQQVWIATMLACLALMVQGMIDDYRMTKSVKQAVRSENKK